MTPIQQRATTRPTCWRLTSSTANAALYHWGDARRADVAEAAPPIVFVHGLGDCAEVWHDVAAALTDWPGTIHAVDLPGHGRGDAFAGGTARDMARCLEHLLTPVLRGRRFCLVGHSLGADVSLHLAGGPLASQVDRLALLDFVGRMSASVSGMVPDALRQRQSVVTDAESYGTWLASRLPFASDTVLFEYARRCFAAGAVRPRFHLGTLDTQRYMTWGDQSIVADFDARLSRAPCEVILLRAALSGLLDRDVALQTAERHGLGLVGVPRAGHALCLDNPVAVAEALSGHLRDPA